VAEGLSERGERDGRDIEGFGRRSRTALVVGPRNPTQLDSALEGLALRLSPAERDELAELFP